MGGTREREKDKKTKRREEAARRIKLEK